MKKLHIVICDSNIVDAKFYEDMFVKLGKKHHISIASKLYEYGFDLLDDLKHTELKKRIDVIFYAISKGNEVETLLSIRDAKYVGLLLFLGDSKMILSYEQLFDTEICNFISKNQSENDLKRLERVSTKVIELATKNHSEKIVLSYAGEIRQIEISDILYFEVKERNLIVHYRDKENFTFISALSKIENQLKGRGFMRVSRFFLISIDAIESFTSKGAIMSDGEQIPLGRKYYKELKQVIEENRGR